MNSNRVWLILDAYRVILMWCKRLF